MQQQITDKLERQEGRSHSLCEALSQYLIAGAEENHEILSHDNQCTSWDLNWAPLEYESRGPVHTFTFYNSNILLNKKKFSWYSNRLQAGWLVFNSQQGPIQPPTEWVLCTLSPGVKQPGREGDPLLTPHWNVKIKNGAAVPPFYHISSWHGA
jgi:hypothetical protein